MWYLQHIRENKRITCLTYRSAVVAFYSQWRDDDGSIPWVIRNTEED